jgi:tryptophan 7-halogenase
VESAEATVAIRRVVVLGAGSAGLIAAIGLKRKIPHLEVRVVRSPELGVIGVGESTTPNFPTHMFDYLGINIRHFFNVAQPTWKLGIHFLWGPRPYFNYGFSRQLDAQLTTLPLPNGYFCDNDFTSVDRVNALMDLGKAFLRQPNGGGPKIESMYGFHLENIKLVAALEGVAREIGVDFIDAKVEGAETSPTGIAAVILADGRRVEADLFIDASGFRSELLGRTLNEPFQSFDRSLFCDRALVGNWDRTTEPILPYTTAETMDSGWCWRIDHEKTINRGYVYCSSAISDEAARAEFQRKNPLATCWDHVVKFRPGRYQRAWIGNVIGIGNSCGFVEPLESSALMMVCWQCESMITCLQSTQLRPTPTIRELFNETVGNTWDELRNFLALHYRANTRLDTSFWQQCRAECDVSGIADMLKFYEENGPTGLCRHFLERESGNFFGVEGFLVILVGNRYPYRARHVATDQERLIWNQHRAGVTAEAQTGMDIAETLSYLRHPAWRWNGEA